MLPTLFILEEKAEITPAKALALYKAYFRTIAKDIRGSTIASIAESPIRVIGTKVL